MTYSNEQLYEIQVAVARRIINIDRLLLSTINKQHAIEKFLSSALPDLPAEIRAGMLASVAECDTALEHLEAASNSFAQTVEAFANLK